MADMVGKVRETVGYVATTYCPCLTALIPGRGMKKLSNAATDEHKDLQGWTEEKILLNQTTAWHGKHMAAQCLKI